jgi:hypothetical protein
MKEWPFGAALRGEAPNRLMLRWLKTVVVSDEEKAPERRQVGAGKTTVAEASKLFQMTSKPERWCVLRDKPGGCPSTGQAASGVEMA